MLIRSIRSTAAVVCIIAVVVFSFPARAGGFQPKPQNPPDAESGPELAKTVSFEENRGQLPAAVRYLARAGSANVFLTADEAVYVFPDVGCGPDLMKVSDCDANSAGDGSVTSAFALRMKIVGANPDSRFGGEAIREHRTNYFKGDRETWRSDIPNFDRVRYGDVYDGISMVWHGLGDGSTRYDFIVDPGADAGRIALEFNGAESIAFDPDGNLVIQTPAGPIRQNKPLTYQETGGFRREIESRFVISDKVVGFAVGEYDRSLPLVIDPTVTINNLAFSTQIGSFANEFSNDIAVDANGNTYITGRTLSPAYPTTAGTFDTSANGAEDVFVSKINASGSAPVFSTFLGGQFFDEGLGIAVDQNGDVFVAGAAGNGFPTTASAYDITFNGGADVFVAKLNSAGSSLVYSTYIGAAQVEFAQDLAIDPSGNAYVIVRTSDAIVDYPTTAGAFDTTHNGSDDVAVTKLNGTGTALVFSSFLGGSGIENGTSIAVNAAGEAYVGGTTTDDVTDFPTTPGSNDTTVNGLTDFFVTRFNAAGSALTYSTVIGGAGIDNASGLAIDPAGNAYIVGSVSPGFPTTPGAFDSTASGSNEIGASKLSADGSTLLYSTFIGGTQSDTAAGVATDIFGNAYIVGSNFGGDHPVTTGAFDTTFNGSSDATLTILNQNGTALVYSTYLGGGGADDGSDIAVDGPGNVYLTGRTSLSGAAFPTHTEAYQRFNAGGSDGFVTKFGDFVIGGRVIDAATGNPVSNVMIALSGQVSGFVLTGADGRFGFLDTVPGEPHAVSATRPGYSINPAVFNIAALANNRELIFVATVGSPTGGSGGTLRFQNLSYSKSENGGSITVTIDRTGEIQTTDPVTVDFTTVDGSAIAGQDYQPVSGVITFNALELTKTVTIPVTNDDALEPRESFSVSISNPTNNADIEPNRASANVQILDEDLSAGDLVISEFRQRGRLGANDEYVKLFNPNDFDVTIQTADGSAGLTLARAAGGSLTSVATIPNHLTIGARGHYLLTNNNPNGGFSLIDYPTGRGTTISVGDQAFSSDIPDNSSLVLFRTSDTASFDYSNALDMVGFTGSAWIEGKPMPAISAQNSETSFVRRLAPGGIRDSDDNRSDFVIVDSHATVFENLDQSKLLSVLGAPAPETSESLRMLSAAEIALTDPGFETYDPTPVPNGRQGMLTVYRTITNNTGTPFTALRLRAADFPTVGSPLQMRYSSRPDFRLASSSDEPGEIKGLTLAAERLQPNGGGLNSTLTADSISSSHPLLPGQSVTFAIRFTVMRFGRHPLLLVVEGAN